MKKLLNALSGWCFRFSQLLLNRTMMTQYLKFKLSYIREHENFMSNWAKGKKLEAIINQVSLSGRQKNHKIQSEKETHEKRKTQIAFPRYKF